MLTHTVTTQPNELPSSSSSAPVYSDEMSTAKRARFCFDDSDDEPFDQRINNDEAPADVTEEVPEAFSLRPKRRLSKNTAPQNTEFSNTPLANRKDYKIKMVERKLDKNKFKAMQATAKRTAISILAMQPPTMIHSDVNESLPDIQQHERPHTSHEIQTLQNDNDIIYCKVCSAWSARLKLKRLRQPCEGLKNGNRSMLKLLNAGVAPLPGAKMPTSHSRALTGRGSYLRK